MARKTYLQLVNDVLERLREPTVTSHTQSTYSTLVGKLVNDAKDTVEDAWSWNELRTEFVITTADGTKLYSLTDFQERFRIHEVWNDTRNARVRPADDAYIERRLNAQTDPTGTPENWRLFGVDANGDPRMEFYPTPNAVETINVYATVTQAELTADATALTVPHRPVVLKAYAMAVSERGEHGGNLFDETMREFNNALNEAVAQDNLNVARGLSSDWRPE